MHHSDRNIRREDFAVPRLTLLRKRASSGWTLGRFAKYVGLFFLAIILFEVLR